MDLPSCQAALAKPTSLTNTWRVEEGFLCVWVCFIPVCEREEERQRPDWKSSLNFSDCTRGSLQGSGVKTKLSLYKWLKGLLHFFQATYIQVRVFYRDQAMVCNGTKAEPRNTSVVDAIYCKDASNVQMQMQQANLFYGLAKDMKIYKGRITQQSLCNAGEEQRTTNINSANSPVQLLCVYLGQKLLPGSPWNVNFLISICVR